MCSGRWIVTLYGCAGLVNLKLTIHAINLKHNGAEKQTSFEIKIYMYIETTLFNAPCYSEIITIIN